MDLFLNKLSRALVPDATYQGTKSMVFWFLRICLKGYARSFWSSDQANGHILSDPVDAPNEIRLQLI